MKNSLLTLYATLLFSLGILGGCGFSHHVGSSNLKAESVAKIEKGKTTKEQVLELLGPPQTTRTQTPTNQPPASSIQLPSHLTASEIWSYWSNNIEGTAVVLPFVAHTDTKSSSYTVSIFFSGEGIVTDYQTIQTNY